MKLAVTLLLLFTCTLLITCEKIDRDWDNPWDEKADLDPEDWAPQNLEIELISTTERKLTWQYGDYNIEGFKIDRKEGDGEWKEAFATPDKNARSWRDTDIQQGVFPSYRIYAFAGDNASASADALLYYNQTEVVDVLNPATGKTWMDRNMGASRAATSSTDDQAYGDLYQWGRAADGHQKRNSGTTSTLSSSDTPGHGNFILAPNSPYDWRSPQNDNLWQGVNGINNPCPPGYRLPTSAEWDAEVQSWSSNNSAGAFASPLKLPVAGDRYYSNGSFPYVGSRGYYWSSTVDGSRSRFLLFNSIGAFTGSYYRASGFSVRCLKD